MIDEAGPNVRVIKLGGSLLDLPDVAGRLRNWLARQATVSNIALVGGGRLADVVRDYDRLHSMSDYDSHWLAIRAMELNSRLLASLLREAHWLDSLCAIPQVGWDKRACERGPTIATVSPSPDDEPALPPLSTAPLSILNPYHFLREDERSEQPLPATWWVTSDSIAARAAAQCRASELVLLKSALPPPGATIDDAAAAGYVDAMFPDESRHLRHVRCVNLREPPFPEVTWRGGALEDWAKME